VGKKTNRRFLKACCRFRKETETVLSTIAPGVAEFLA